ncbi:MAG: ABC transporter ATP-binding protein [Chloroflexi bacterium]|nr:ABC transporter ATP-binding protein [Chloroflexota bacterium]MCH8340233.1 ABC transporter ATP-binding protein [Chloroflexota bacterium]MCH8875496.1 ABC transporter ATP-binding protein [Chloroflexota bacterium]MCI0773930.1 ABC transporter ATP-binding protein [Chloroflexota bacterium]MCI0805388.1 ABC transporter ATP-binding protein [Chloroflexota bacterium]
MKELLRIEDLQTRFYTRDGVVHAVNGVSYSIDEGEILGVVGESGCGKSVHALSILRLIPDPPGRIESGEVWFDGKDLLTVSDEEIRRVRGGQLAMVFQDPMSSLNPAMTVGFQIVEALRLHLDMTERQAKERTTELLTTVGIPDAKNRLDDYPHQFSGGMRQRVMIAMGLSCNPKLLIADEPTTALDVTIQAQIVDLIKRLQAELGMAVIWITHDLGVVADLAEKVNVMYAGYIVEHGNVRDVFKRTRHPYTIGLLGSLPRLDEDPGTELSAIPGFPPDLIDLKPGCPFAARCPHAIEQCWNETPRLEPTETKRHTVACWRWEEIAQGVA